MARTGKARFTAADWIRAAIVAMSRGGASSVSIEGLAAELGASKGSFYWFFANRDALLAAALRRWLEVATDDVAAAVSELPDPRARLRALLGVAFGGGPWWGIEIALQSDVENPEVRRALAEADRRRLAILRDTFAELGTDAGVAGRTALTTYAAYLGFLQLQRTAPDLVPSGVDREAFLDAFLEDALHAGSKA